MRHIDEFTIHSFRGLRDIKLEGAAQINLLVGDNNSGKTSILEALSLFCDSLNLRRWSSTASMREVGGLASLSQSERIIWLFPQRESYDRDSSLSAAHEILLSGLGDFPVEKVVAHYEQFSEMVQARLPIGETENELFYEDRDKEIKDVKVEISTFLRNGTSSLAGIDREFHETFIFPGSRYSLPPRKAGATTLPAQLVSPSSHRLSSTPQLWTDVINAEAKEEAIRLLRFFDNDIQDVDIIIGFAGRPTISVKHKKLKRAPLSIFGDGLRRIFTLAAAIPGVRDGLLLVDELELAIHTKALEKSFSWLVKACVQNNIQLFATTHSLEAVDALLQACDGNTDLATYRLLLNDGQINVTRFDKAYLTRLREELGVEIRW
jgi:AAA15 family ATPase/GTPase